MKPISPMLGLILTGFMMLPHTSRSLIMLNRHHILPLFRTLIPPRRRLLACLAMISVHLCPLPSHVPLPSTITNTYSMVTRSKAGIFKPKAYHALQITPRSLFFQAILALNEPRGFKYTVKHLEWLAAMDDEIATLKHNHTGELVPRPRDHNVVGYRWIFKTKLHADGSVEHHKARLVAKGYSQIHDLDFDDTLSPVVRPPTVCIILSLVITHGWHLHQLNVKNAFLHGYLNEAVYMDQPSGYTDPRFPHHVCLLKRALYGLKQPLVLGFNASVFFFLRLLVLSLVRPTLLYLFIATQVVCYIYYSMLMTWLSLATIRV